MSLGERTVPCNVQSWLMVVSKAASSGAGSCVPPSASGSLMRLTRDTNSCTSNGDCGERERERERERESMRERWREYERRGGGGQNK